MIIRRLIVPLIVALVTAMPVWRWRKSLPALPPVRAAAPPASDPAFPPVRVPAPANDPAFPPVNGWAPQFVSDRRRGAASGAGSGPAPRSAPQSGEPTQECMKEFMPLREDAEKKGKLIKAASDRHATAEEACKLIKIYGAAENKMIYYVETHGTNAEFPRRSPIN